MAAVTVLISLVLPYGRESLALPITLALAAMVLASVLVYFFYRFLLGRGQCSLSHISQALLIVALAAVSTSMAITYGHLSLALSVGLVATGTVLAFISLFVFCRFLLGKGPGTSSEIKATQRALNLKLSQ